MDSTFLTQHVPITPASAPLSYKLLDGIWPILEDFPPVPDHVLNRIKTEANGASISTHIQYLSLGLFLIDTELLQPHATQRPLDQNHVKQLCEDFETIGIHRMDHPGVVIGLGEGWHQMKNNGPHCYRISKDSSHLHLLATEQKGPIGQVIRGGHRTNAIRNYSLYPDNANAHQNFWLYNVLAPGQFCFIYFVLLLIYLVSSNKHTSPPTSS